MDRMRYTFDKSFWAFAIVAIVFLGPSSGLITLTVPDEQYGSILGVPDMPHIGKRASDDSQHLAYDAAAFSQQIHHSFFSESLSSLARRYDLQRISPPVAQIRAPPTAFLS